MDGHAARRRQELAQLWLVVRYAPTEDDRLEQVLEAALPTATPDDGGAGDEPAFDPVSMVRRAQHNEGR